MRKTNGSRPPVVLRKMAWVEERLSCTRGLVDNLIADGKLEVVRFGRAKRITERSVLRLVDEQLKQLNDNGGKNHAGVPSRPTGRPHFRSRPAREGSA